MSVMAQQTKKNFLNKPSVTRNPTHSTAYRHDIAMELDKKSSLYFTRKP